MTEYDGLLDVAVGLEQAKRIAALQAENEGLRKWIETDERLLDTRDRVFDAIPPCPEHGPQCIPHCLDWIERVQAENERLRAALDLLYYEILAKMTLEAMVSLGTTDFELDDYILESSSGLWHGVKTARDALGKGK